MAFDQTRDALATESTVSPEPKIAGGAMSAVIALANQMQEQNMTPEDVVAQQAAQAPTTQDPNQIPVLDPTSTKTTPDSPELPVLDPTTVDTTSPNPDFMPDMADGAKNGLLAILNAYNEQGLIDPETGAITQPPDKLGDNMDMSPGALAALMATLSQGVKSGLIDPVTKEVTMPEKPDGMNMAPGAFNAMMAMINAGITNGTIPDPTVDTSTIQPGGAGYPEGEGAATPGEGPGDTRDTGVTDSQLRMQSGLTEFLKQDSPLLAHLRAQGTRRAAAAGMGQSSYAARAAEGAAMDVAAPLVTAAVELDSKEFTAGEERTLAKYLKGEELSSAERVNMAKIRSNEYMNDKAIISGEKIAAASNTVSMLMQQHDIDFKEWLSETGFEQEKILQGGRLSVELYDGYLDGLSAIYSNPETSGPQKLAAAATLSTKFGEGLDLAEVVSGMDLSRFWESIDAKRDTEIPGDETTSVREQDTADGATLTPEQIWALTQT